jgi:glycosyltransferase involved in cell wall biosynthesis
MFKVLVISYYYPPLALSGVQRTLKFTKYFKANNWEPVVLTTGEIAYYAYDYSLLKEANDANIRIVRTLGGDINSMVPSKGPVKIPPEFLRKLLGRISKSFFIPDNKKGWSKKALIKAREILSSEHFDLIFVSAPPFSSTITAVKLKHEFNLPVVIDYRDLWYCNHFAFYPTPFHKIFHKRLEYKVLKAADRFIVINRKMKEKMLNKYSFLTFDDVAIITQGFDPKDFEGLVPEKKPNNKMRLTYSGIFYEFITPKFFLKAFKKLTIERPEIAGNIELHFAGFLRNENRKLIRKLELQEFVKEYGYLNHRDALLKTLSSDVLWLMVGNGKHADAISTGKAFEYFGTQKPILACIPDGILKSTLEEYGAAFITKPDDIDEIMNMIIKIYRLYVNNNLPKPKDEFVSKHRRDFLTEQLVKHFQFLVKAES